MKKRRGLVLPVVLSLALVACGGGGGGGGASTPNATVNGNISNASTAMRAAERRRWSLACSAFLSPVPDAFAGRNGIHVTVNGPIGRHRSEWFFTITGPSREP